MQATLEKEGVDQGWASFLVEVDRLKEAISLGVLKRRLVVPEDGGPQAAAVSRSINEILDTLIQTYERAVTSMDGMCTGRIPEPFKDGFPGEFARAKNVCNDFIDVINRRNSQIKRMTEAAASGDLRIRANVEEFTGANRRIFVGFNAMFDAWLAPVAEIQRVLNALGNMDLTARVEGQYAGDYARIAEALNLVCSKLAKEVQQIGQHTMVMASASEQLSALTKEMASGAVETSRLATSAATSSERVSTGMAAATTGSSELLDSIREIAQNAVKASSVVQSAVVVTDRTKRKINHLGESSAEISKVIKVINGIAQQTNLLALNATIEAARAGEAGRGFAVVATEVKELAKGTAGATEQVSNSIAAIQNDTRESVAGMAEIATVTNEIQNISQTIASAVEEQTATTNEVGRLVSEAAETAAAIARQMGGLVDAASQTSRDAKQTDFAIADLNRILGQLQTFVAMFNV